MNCNDPAILPIIKVIQNAFIIIEILAPILAILSLTIILTKMMYNPDDKKLINNAKNAVIALVIIFIIPVLINVTMLALGEKFSVSACWKAASKYNFSKGGYVPVSNTDPTNFYTKKKYEVGDPSDLTPSGKLKLTTEGRASQKEWLNALSSTADELIKAHAIYNGGSSEKTLAAAKQKKKVNCASYVSYAMHKVGLLPEGKLIYVKGNKLKGSGADYLKNSKKVTIDTPNKLVNQLNLKPGDIVGFADPSYHTCVYAGKYADTGIKGGQADHWYTAGGADVREKNYGPRRKQYGNRKVVVLIRPKYNDL